MTPDDARAFLAQNHRAVMVTHLQGDGFTTHPTMEFHTFRVGVNYRFNGLFQ